MSAEDVAKAFIGHYTQTFTANRAALQGLYVRPTSSALLFKRVTEFCCLPAPLLTQQAASTVTWEGQKFTGPEQIMQKLNVSVARRRYWPVHLTAVLVAELAAGHSVQRANAGCATIGASKRNPHLHHRADLGEHCTLWRMFVRA